MSSKPAKAGRGSQGALTLPSADDVVLLQAIRDYPAVTLLMNTTPATVMTRDDATALRGMARRAAERLRREHLGAVEGAVIAAMERLTAQAATGPTSTAIAVYASRATAEIHRLPVSVRDRVVIDPTFATRDLIRALHRTPRHVVLVLTSREARLLEGVAGTMCPAARGGFPLHDDRRRRPDPARPGLKDCDVAAFLRTVDAALGVYLRLHPAPLILVGPNQVLATFEELSTNLARLAGTISSNLANEPPSALARRTGPVLQQYLRSRQDEALELLDRRTSARRVAFGMPAVWLAARRERPEMLAVEEGLFYPARVSPDGDVLTPAGDVEHPDVVDDAVDELIELVLVRGGWVALVADGALAAHERVALTLLPGDGR